MRAQDAAPLPLAGQRFHLRERLARPGDVVAFFALPNASQEMARLAVEGDLG